MKKNHKRLTGVVVSDKMHKTITVRIESWTKHPLYNKIVKKFRKVKAHDENNTAKIGNTVVVEETKPLSKEKRWRLIEVLK
jgi:small subunit ribosomal protein S17